MKSRALAFQKRWQIASSESSDKQTFYNEFFNIFGIDRIKVAVFEQQVEKLNNRRGSIDLFWPKKLLVEHKSKGVDLKKAVEQAYDYCLNIENDLLPEFLLVSDFHEFRLIEIANKQKYYFTLPELHEKLNLFNFMTDYKKQNIAELDPINLKAAERMGELYDNLKNNNASQKDLELFLVRILYCLFADDTDIFKKKIFHDLIDKKTRSDGSDVGDRLAHLFQTLNTPKEKRPSTLDFDLNDFDYINGKLFADTINILSFSTWTRTYLINCCSFVEWRKISPAIFGSLFQAIADKKKRRSTGAHYTSEKNILRTIKPLFLDNLYQEFEEAKGNKKQLIDFHNKLAGLKFFDPACGCGNFLVVAYRELRKLELEILKILYKGQDNVDVNNLSKIDVDSFYGIELEEFPANIASVAMWLTDHQSNLELSETFGHYYARIPLKKSAKIHHGNALTTDWSKIIDPKTCSYIIGNPPFIGSRMMADKQKSDMEKIFTDVQDWRSLDYVTAWYKKAADYIHGTKIKVGFVATNSITQGLHVGILWDNLINQHGITIHFAHQTFAWSNEAKGKAAVYVVIIGFANYDTDKKILFEYDDIKGEPHESLVSHINPYLDSNKINVAITSRENSLCDMPKMSFGNMPRDGGFFIIDNEEEKEKIIKQNPLAKKYIKNYIGAEEFINGGKRWCLWLVNAEPAELKKMPLVMARIENVKKFRLASKNPSTRKFADTPAVFCSITQPKNDYLLLPSVSSERRKYIPIGFKSKDDILSNLCFSISNATLYHFGILTSAMHMAWVAQVCGRLKSDFRYSKDIVYNNYPWPKNPSADKIKKIESLGQRILDIRKKYENKNTLADLYDPNTMPADLLRAHQELDKLVDDCYDPAGFASNSDRLTHLFNLYEEYIKNKN